MRGPDEQTADMFSYVSPEARVRADHPLRAIRQMTDQGSEAPAALDAITSAARSLWPKSRWR